jgi:hypothetical protein
MASCSGSTNVALAPIGRDFLPGRLLRPHGPRWFFGPSFSNFPARSPPSGSWLSAAGARRDRPGRSRGARGGSRRCRSIISPRSGEAVPRTPVIVA